MFMKFQDILKSFWMKILTRNINKQIYENYYFHVNNYIVY